MQCPAAYSNGCFRPSPRPTHDAVRCKLPDTSAFAMHEMTHLITTHQDQSDDAPIVK